MSVDALLKKYFVAVVLGLVALTAYFQAAGFSQLVGSALAPETAPDAAAPLAGRLPPFERPRATAILERNPFDSVTGPLVGGTIELPEAARPVEVHEPLTAPACDGVQVFIITESNDPLWSFAALQGPGESHPSLRRVGDAVGDRKVAYIGFNPLEASPAVWLEGGSLCQSLMFVDQPTPPPSKPASTPPKNDAPARPGGPGAVDPDIKSRIQKVSDTEFNVDRGVVDKILENQAELMKSARIVPEQKDGQVVGIRLFGVRPDTLLGTLGLQNGDRLESINGFDMGSPEKALEAYARLRTASNMSVKVNRRGQPMTIEYKIK